MPAFRRLAAEAFALATFLRWDTRPRLARATELSAFFPFFEAIFALLAREAAALFLTPTFLRIEALLPFEDFEIVGYEFHPHIPAPIAI